MRVRTVYRYFPNKFAIPRELARGLAEAWGAWCDGARLASAMLLETAIATLDAALTGSPNRRGPPLDELVDMQVAYLERLLSSGRTAAERRSR